MKRVILIFLISTFQINLCFEQQRIVPPSPNATSLGLFGEIPVSPYTGVPNISIPIYTVKSGSISLPINLSYHASGIKVAQEASWVGLGWALEAGGVISRTVCGYDDFGSFPLGFYYEQSFPNVGTDNNLNPENAQNSYNFYDCIQNGTKDGEPDMFYFNFNGNSGKFYFQKRDIDNSAYPFPVCSQKNSLDIKYNISNQDWIITDAKGYKYYFGTQEVTKSYSTIPFSSVPPTEPTNIPENTVQPEVITSWYLDKIESPTGDYITFTYDSKNHPVKSQTYFNEHVDKQIALDHTRIEGDGFIYPDLYGIYKQYSYYYTVTKEIYLSQITFSNGKVIFNTSDRSDMETKSTYGVPSYNAQKLESIEISDNQNRILKCSLNYSYFDNNFSNTSSKRLRLNSVDFFDKNIIQKNSYVFSYNNGQLPDKKSNAIDYWGLFNDNGNYLEWGYNLFTYSYRGTLIPGVNEVLNGHTVEIMGANRNIDIVKNKYGILTSIKYPTGGETDFTYESNSYSNFTPYYVDNDTTIILRAGGDYKTEDGSEITSDMAEFRINEAQTIDINYGCSDPNITILLEDEENNICNFYSSLSGTYAKLYSVDGAGKVEPPIKSYSVEGGTLQDLTLETCYSGTWQSYFSEKRSLQPGTYRIEVIALQPNNGTTFYISAKYRKPRTLICNKLGGGLRVKEIKNNSDGVSTVKTYDYTKDGVVSSGKIMSAPTHHYNEYLTETSAIILPGYIVQSQSTGLYKAGMSNSYSPLGYSAAGNPVGYDVVTETITGNGKTKYYYHNTADVLADVSDRVLPGVPNLSFLNNGLLNKMETYDKDGNIQTTKENIYTKSTLYNNSVKGVKTYRFPGAATLFIKFYDRVGEWWKLDETIITDHVGDNDLKVSTTNEYNLKNLLPNKITMQSSAGKTIEKQITYPCDIADNGIYKGMTDDNMTEYPVEEREYVDGKLIKGELNTFNTSYLPYEKYLVETNSPLSSFNAFDGTINSNYYSLPEIRYNVYGNQGRINEILLKDGTPVTYLWSYNNEYPIAEIKNASFDDVSNALHGTTPDELSSSSNPDMSKVNALRADLPNAQVTTYTYKPLIGIWTATDPRGITTTYNYDDFNRLMNIKDLNGKTLKSFDYHYKQ